YCDLLAALINKSNRNNNQQALASKYTAIQMNVIRFYFNSHLPFTHQNQTSELPSFHPCRNGLGFVIFRRIHDPKIYWQT
ncbi:MAG: hypothetical protein LW700_13360, partial [Gemmataceae bacterium]|nr:hypothetical protein [Gemmataceae bacterium]